MSPRVPEAERLVSRAIAHPASGTRCRADHLPTVSVDRMAPRWRTADVWAISGSAFFADLGYQAVMATFPLYLVLRLHASVGLYGVAAALAYGGGALLGYVGGRLGERFGAKRVTLAGNLLIPLLSLAALPGDAAGAIALICLGWWFRSIRSPTRRSMLAAAVPDPADRAAAFGFLHALDVGGATLAGLGALAAVAAGVPYRWLFLATIVPLLLSSLCVALAHPPETALQKGPGGSKPSETDSVSAAPSGRDGAGSPAVLPALGLLLGATTLFGISAYSLGFPVLDVAQARGAGAVAGVGAFVVIQAASSATGYLLGPRLGRRPSRRLRELALGGYGVAAVASAGLAVGGARLIDVPSLLVAVALLGVALGVVETLEPALVTDLARQRSANRAYGALSAARGGGVLIGNLLVGGLFVLGAVWGFTYAALAAAAAALLVLLALRAAAARRDELHR